MDKIIEYLEDINIYFLDEDFEELIKKDHIFENAYNILKQIFHLYENEKKISRQILETISKEYSSFFGYCRDSKNFMNNFSLYVVYKENYNLTNENLINENLLSKISSFITAYEPTSLATIAEKLEYRKIWKGLFNEFVRKFMNDEDKTLENAKAFLILKNFHPDFVEYVYNIFVKNKGISKTQQKKYTGKETIIYIEDFFKEIAKETIKRGGLKFVNKKNYSLDNDPFIKPTKKITTQTKNLEKQKNKILTDIKKELNNQSPDIKKILVLIDKFLTLETDPKIVEKFKKLKKKFTS